jgi:hypothetical protein
MNNEEWRIAHEDGCQSIAVLLTKNGEGAEIELAIRDLSKLLGVSQKAVRADVEKLIARPDAPPPNSFNLYDPAPAICPSGLDALLNAMVRIIRARVALTYHEAVAVALWCAASWGVRAKKTGLPGPEWFPRLAIGSPSKRCGKSTLMDTIAHLVLRPLRADDISTSTLFRATETTQPTLLIDEADELLKRNRDLAALLNSGVARSGQVMRSVETRSTKGAKSFEPAAFATFCAVAVAGIGKLTDTLADRSIRIVLQRRPVGATRKRMRARDLIALRERICPSLAGHADAMALAMEAGMPDATLTSLGLPSERDIDNWEPMGAVAVLAGGAWPVRWHAAAVSLAGEMEAASGTEKALMDIWVACRELRLEHCETARDLRRSQVKAGVKHLSKLLPGPLTRIDSGLLALKLKDMPGSFVAHLDSDQQIKNKVARTLKGFGIQPEFKRNKGGAPSRGYDLKAIRAANGQYGGG